MGLKQVVSVQHTIAKSAEGYPLLGHVIYWSLNDINVKYSDFVQHLENLGLPTDVANKVQAKSALIKAIRSNAKGRKNSFHRGVVDNAAKASFAIVGTASVNEITDDVEFATETKVVLNKGTKDVEITGTNATEIREAYEAYKDTYTSDRFREVVLKLVKVHCQGMSVRERGGVYFVPSSHNETFEKLQKLFDMFPNCSLEVVPVIDTAQAKKAMWKAFTGDVSEDLRKMKEDLESLPLNASESSLHIRMDRFQKLKDKVENYEIVLSGTAAELKGELSMISAEIKKRFL